MRHCPGGPADAGTQTPYRAVDCTVCSRSVRFAQTGWSGQCYGFSEFGGPVRMLIDIAEIPFQEFGLISPVQAPPLQQPGS